LGQRYGVSGAEILVQAGERRLVGGQEDQLIDIAVQLAARSTAASTANAVSSR
jgi:4-hydroxy 2-oxovalerate aldolase